MNHRLHVAVLDEEFPFPLNSGKRIRTYNLLSRLASTHRITYLAHQNPNFDEQHTAILELARLGIEPIVVERAIPPKSGARFYFRLLANLASSFPYSVSSHYSRAFAQAVENLAKRNPPDLWHAEWTPYAQYLSPQLPGATHPRLVVAHNVESLIWQRYMENEQHPLKRWYIRQQWRKFRIFESKIYSSFESTVAVSEPDAQLIRSEYRGRRVQVVENGVDIQTFCPNREITRIPGQMLFLGSLDWRPNLDGVTWFLDHVFPKVRVKHPEVKFLIVGRKPPEWLLEKVKELPGVEICANVPNVVPYLNASSMLVVPLRIGGGSRLKIIEALSTELPVISTTVGAEGLELQPRKHLEIADTPEELAEKISQGIANPKQLLQQGIAGREKILATYHWDLLAKKLEAIWLNLSRIRSISPLEEVKTLTSD